MLQSVEEPFQNICVCHLFPPHPDLHANDFVFPACHLNEGICSAHICNACSALRNCKYPAPGRLHNPARWKKNMVSKSLTQPFHLPFCQELVSLQFPFTGWFGSSFWVAYILSLVGHEITPHAVLEGTCCSAIIHTAAWAEETINNEVSR